MTAREYAESVGHEVVGKLTYSEVDLWYRVWIDEAGNEYMLDEGQWYIATVDGEWYDGRLQ